MSDLECPECGGELNDLACATCGAKFDTVLGVPFIGAYEAEDALGLIEIAANVSNRDTMFFTADSVAQVETACAEYDAAVDKETFTKNHPLASEWWFPNRYQEFLSVNRLLEGISLKGKRVLDIGAGLGFDSQRLALRGADVTALEFSPILAANGQNSFPGMRWIGGFSHALPFKTGSFDAVFFNAALHHMRDIPTAIAEALRVLKVGGTVITTGDPFRPDAATEQLELDVFDKHTAVLLGINEQIPRFGDFAATLRQHAGKLQVELITHILYGGRSGSGPDLTEWTAWDLARDGEMLGTRSGSLDMRVTLREPLGEPRARQTRGVLRPAEYVNWMIDEAHAVSRLVDLMPAEYVDRPFPDTHGKFDLLNGWRLPSLTKPGVRTAYRRARWFLTRGKASRMSFMLRSPAETDFEFRLNNEVVHRAKVGPEWSQIDISLKRIAAGQRFVAEIKRVEASDDFDACCFDVRSALPIHFFTIVLNGEPFIRYHERVLAKLDVPWHWHIVEGVAALKHDTAWSVAAGGCIADSLHDKGRSNDGTSAYLDELASRFPEQVTVYRKPFGEFWDGKLEMVNAPIASILDECLLWQIDSDELWTVDQIKSVRAAFLAEPKRSAAYYWCWYFVGPKKIISTRYNYAQNPKQEWLRTWRFRPGMRWAAHEPPTLVEPVAGEPGRMSNVAEKNPFSHDEMERLGAVFQHFAYATEDQVAFKEIYYGYRNARSQWRALQACKGSGQLKDYLGWVSDNTMFDDATTPYLIDPIATLDGASGDWQFEPDATWRKGSGTGGLAGPRIVVDAIFWQYLSSGIGRVWENVLREWVKSGFIKNVIVLDRAGTAPRIPGVHYWSIPRHSYGFTGGDSLLLDEVCRRLNADLFVSTYYSCTTTVPSFFVGHDMIPEMLGFPMEDEAWHEKRRAILHAVGHSMVSQSSANDLEELYPVVPRGSTFVVHNGVAPVFSRPRPEEIDAFRAKHGLSTRPYVLMVGERMGFGGYKNGSLVFRALGSMPQDKAPTLVCVGGHQEIKTELRDQAPRLGVRRLALDDEELKAAYAGAHALLYPSRYEGFGMVPAEAMACGTPAIVCRNSSLPEVVGDAALFVDENDPGDMVRAITTLLDPAVRADFIARGFAQVRPFSFAATAQKLAAALTETYGRLASQELIRSSAAWTEMRQLLAAQQQHQADHRNAPQDIPNMLPISYEIDAWSFATAGRYVVRHAKTTLFRWKNSIRKRNRKRLQWQRRALGKR